MISLQGLIVAVCVGIAAVFVWRHLAGKARRPNAAQAAGGGAAAPGACGACKGCSTGGGGGCH